MQMAEVLKFNGLKSYWPNEHAPGTATQIDAGSTQTQRLNPVRRPSSHSRRGSSGFLNGSPSKHGMLGEIYAGFRSGVRTPETDKLGMHFSKNRPGTPAEKDGIRHPTCKVCWETIDGLHAECCSCGWRAHKECMSALGDVGEEISCDCQSKSLEYPQEIKWG